MYMVSKWTCSFWLVRAMSNEQPRSKHRSSLIFTLSCTTATFKT